MSNNYIEPNNLKLYGYHITTNDNLTLIKHFGLIPNCGERSQAIGDTEETICFCPIMLFIDKWIDLLYSKEDIINLELLRFSLEGIDYQASDPELGGLYTKTPIEPVNIKLLEKKEHTSLKECIQGKKLIWSPLQNYKKT